MCTERLRCGICGESILVGKYQAIYLVFAYLGAVMNMKLVWGMADVWNCLMALPNLYAIWRLRKRIEKP